MKKFILFSILSVLFYAVPGHTMFSRDGETQKRGGYYAPYLESILLAQAQETQARELAAVIHEELAAAVILYEEQLAAVIHEEQLAGVRLYEEQLASVRRREEKEKAEEEAAGRARKAENVRLREEQAAAARERRAEKARLQEEKEKAEQEAGRKRRLTKAKRQAAEIVQNAETAEREAVEAVEVIILRAIEERGRIRNTRAHARRAKRRAKKAGAAEKLLECGNLLEVVEQESARSMQHLRETGTLWEEQSEERRLEAEQMLASPRAAAPVAPASRAGWAEREAERRVAGVSALQEEVAALAEVAEESEAWELVKLAERAPTSSRAHGAGTKEPAEPEAAE